MPVKSTTKRARGRPAHVATAALKRKVSIAAGGGMLHESIAIALEISTDTLRKYYEKELSVGANQRRMEVLEARYRVAVRKGSSSAAKAYLADHPEMAVPPAAPAPAVVEPAPLAATETSAKKLGKKEQAAVDAVGAADGTDWNELLPRPGTPLQ